MEKRGVLNLSINAIVVLTISIVVLVLILGFISGFFEKSSENVEELFGREREPVTPAEDEPITLSRGKIKTNPGSTEVIKISVLNPTNKDWLSRDDLYAGLSYCSASDRICYISDACDGTVDPDCMGSVDWPCQTEEKDNVCLVNEKYGAIEGMVCPEGEEGGPDGDCGPQNGIDLLIKCSNELGISSVSLPSVIMAGEIQKFTSVLEVKKGVKGNYICEIRVFGNDEDGDSIEGFKKDLIIEVA